MLLQDEPSNKELYTLIFVTEDILKQILQNYYTEINMDNVKQWLGKNSWLGDLKKRRAGKDEDGKDLFIYGRNAYVLKDYYQGKENNKTETWFCIITCYFFY